MIGRDPRVEISDGLVHRLRLLVFADEVRDLLHLADEAIGLVEHVRYRALELPDERRVAAIELGTQAVVPLVIAP